MAIRKVKTSRICKPSTNMKKMPQKKTPLEFSKKLTILDIIVYIALTIILLVVLLIRPELGAFAQNIFAYMTTAYVSLRLGYTAKAGVENYKKIAENYKEIAAMTPDQDEYTCESETTYESEEDDSN